MRGYIRELLQGNRKAAATQPSPQLTIASTAPRPDLPRGAAHTQKQSMFLGGLSLELRMLVYQATLTDPHRFLHILHVTPQYGESPQIGHWRCEDMKSPHPVWQHSCFGCWVEDNTRYFRKATYTNSDLLLLLLTCRTIYSEAVQTLYAENHFSFRGAKGLSRFNSLIPPISWHALRYIHISTIFLTPMQHWMKGSLPPENYNHWEHGCHVLASLSRLHLLRIDMIIWDHFLQSIAELLDIDSIIFILTALLPLRAQIFQVELNIELPELVKTRLGFIPFELLYHKRPFDWETFSV